MTKDELNRILGNHKKWLIGDKDGICANLRGANIRGADLSGANLYSADLRGANIRGADLGGADMRGANLYSANLSGANLGVADLRGANMRGANLSNADLSNADLSGANLYSADLYSADLRGANMRGANLGGANMRGANLYSANLSGADLYSADLSGADLSGANLPITRCIPEEGNFLGYKKCIDEKVTPYILTLEIISDKRVSPIIGRKCRAEKVKTLKIETMDGKAVKNKKLKLIGKTQKCPKTVYQLGKYTKADSFDDSIIIECTHGIHFFATKQEAKDY